MSFHEIVVIEEVRKETQLITTLKFKFKRRCHPGQFVMVWLPECDEIPMSLSYIGELCGITVKTVGSATKKLSSLEVGSRIAVRGPYGKGFSPIRGRSLFVAGGIGAASLLPAAEVMDKETIDFVMGAKTKSELIFIDRAKECVRKLEISTDDGSFGIQGTAVEAAKELVQGEKYDCIYGCGPEMMLFKLYKLSEELGIDCQLSLERYMKCGIGLCGSCAINGLQVCKDGPVFHKKDLNMLKEFGQFKRDSAGKRIIF
ncbi:MAG: dihydroorotate dehydrogenase electron transfer subunit [Methanomassiliicoccales archaeon]